MPPRLHSWAGGSAAGGTAVWQPHRWSQLSGIQGVLVLVPSAADASVAASSRPGLLPPTLPLQRHGRRSTAWWAAYSSLPGCSALTRLLPPVPTHKTKHTCTEQQGQGTLSRGLTLTPLGPRTVAPSASLQRSKPSHVCAQRGPTEKMQQRCPILDRAALRACAWRAHLWWSGTGCGQ